MRTLFQRLIAVALVFGGVFAHGDALDSGDSAWILTATARLCCS